MKDNKIKRDIMNKNNTCKTCLHWKNKQAELDYSTFDGICTCPKWRFETTNEDDVCVLDRLNRSDRYKGDQRFETLTIPGVGRISSRYCLVTAHEFGCIHHVTDKQ